MSMENNDEVRAAIGTATGGEGPLRERVRDLVLKAVLHREVDPQALRQVMKDAVAGLGDGLGNRGEQLGSAVGEAVQGLDEAIAKSVYAVQMALEEAWARGKHFTESDLRQTADAMRALEDDLLGTLRETADRAQGGLRDELNRLGEHLRNTGTDTGARAREVLELLQSRLNSAASGASAEAKDTAKTAAERLAEVASGVLRGLADAIDAKTR